MIFEVIRRHFGVQLWPLDRPVYMKLYPNWVDRFSLSKGYETTDFSTFSSEDEKSTMEHVNRFMTQCSETNKNEYYKLQLLHLSLLGDAFS